MNPPDYNADAGDRSVAELAQQKVAGRKLLAPAARLAGEQLELMMPEVFAKSPAGLIAGKYTIAAPGTIVFVLADERRVATVHVLDQPDLIDQLVERAQVIREFIAE